MRRSIDYDKIIKISIIILIISLVGLAYTVYRAYEAYRVCVHLCVHSSDYLCICYNMNTLDKIVFLFSILGYGFGLLTGYVALNEKKKMNEVKICV